MTTRKRPHNALKTMSSVMNQGQRLKEAMDLLNHVKLVIDDTGNNFLDPASHDRLRRNLALNSTNIHKFQKRWSKSQRQPQ